ncbi:MAG: hypothetical protein AAGU77_07230, partial [Bacillota bacterium]
IDHLRKHQYGRATLLPVSAMRPRLLNTEERATLSTPGCIGVASELVEYDERYRNVMENLLGRTVIVQDLDAGIAINRRANAAFRIATLQGDIIHPGGSMTGGSVQKREFSLLGREREYKQLQQSIRDLEGELKKQAQLRVSKEVEVKELTQSLEQADARLHAHEIDVARHREKLELIARDIRQNGQKRERAELEAAQLLDNIGDIEKERKSIEDVQSGIEEGSAATQEDVQRSQARLNELRAQYEAGTSALTERKVQRMALQKEEDAARAEHTRLMKERTHTARALEENQSALERAAAQETALQAQLEELLSGVGVEQTAVNERKEQQHALEEERQRRQQALSEARAQKDELNARVRELEERRHKQELAQSRMELEFEAMRERMQADYELTYEEALPLRTELGGVTAAHVRIDELKKAIRELGSINVNAVEDFKILNERYETLNAQCDDLT